MPLARGADGKLGVRSNSMSHVSVVMNISTPDVAGFQRSESQIAARLSQTLSRGQRNRTFLQKHHILQFTQNHYKT